MSRPVTLMGRASSHGSTRRRQQSQALVLDLARHAEELCRSTQDSGHLASEHQCAILLVMASRSSEHLAHLAQELAQLTREDRAKVLADAARLSGLRDHGKFIRPRLTGGTVWVGGDLTREQFYGDDGR